MASMAGPTPAIRVALLLVVICALQASGSSHVYNQYMASLRATPPGVDGELGSVRLLTPEQLPGLGEINAGVELLTVKPCAAVAPHAHPNAHQVIYVASGSFVHSQFVNGSLHKHMLGQGEVSATPLGTLHGVSNPSCEDVDVLVVFSDGTMIRAPPAAQQLLSLPPRFLRATFGVEDPAAFRAQASPPGSLIYPLADAACAARCAGAAATQQAASPGEGAATAAGACGSRVPESFNGFMKAAPAVVNSSFGIVQALTEGGMPGLGLTGHALFRVVLRPCSLLLPHYHADANEIVFPLAGTSEAVLLGKDGPIQREVGSGDVVVIPKGMIHSFANPHCEDVEVWALTDSPAPGMTFPAEEVLAFAEKDVQAAFGIPEGGFSSWRESMRAAGGVLASLNDPACAARCASKAQQ